MEMRDESMIEANKTNQDLTLTENQAIEPVCEIEETVINVDVDPEESNEDAPARIRPVYASVEEALQAARDFAAKDAADVQREEVTYLKQQFHSLRIAQHKALRDAAI
ncbi:MAG: hypothetical protein K2G40_07890, partial [Muribaculaceae bacterium]|nr:hypothetical protein [Muribaculaceae bacterium]